MSIIYDALKKVQRNLDGQKKKAEAPAAVPPRPPVTDERVSDLLKALIITSFLGSLLTFVMFHIFYPQENKAIAPAASPGKRSAADARPSPSLAAPEAKPQENQKTTRSASGFVLNGIVKMGQEYVALINNKIVREGDAIGGKKVLSINKDEVKIFDNGEVFVLKRGGF